MKSFREKVYDIARKIPRGKVLTYSDIARLMGKPRAVRAVGHALGQNPHLVVMPCHRVVRSDGSIGGYAGGLKKKIALLKKEGVDVAKGKVDLEKYRWSPQIL